MEPAGGGARMDLPKLIIVSDGTRTGVLLDGVFIGQGIQRLDFSTEDKSCQRKSTIRIMDLDVDAVTRSEDATSFSEFIEGLGVKDMTAPEATGTAN